MTNPAQIPITTEYQRSTKLPPIRMLENPTQVPQKQVTPIPTIQLAEYRTPENQIQPLTKPTQMTGK